MGKRSNNPQPSSPGPELPDPDTSGGNLKNMTNTAEDGSPDNRGQDSALTDDSALPQTCCTNCKTIFEVSPELLASNDTRVRCGECLSIFDALTNLRKDDLPADDYILDDDGKLIDPDGSYAKVATEDSDDFMSSAAEPSVADDDDDQGSTEDTSVLDMTYSDFDLFSGEAGLPEVAYFDQTQDLEHLRFDEPDGDETFSDTLFAHDMTVDAPEIQGPSEAGDDQSQTGVLDPSALDSRVGFVTDDKKSDPLVFKYRDPDAPERDVTFPEPQTGATATIEPIGAGTTMSSRRPGKIRLWLLRALLVLVVAGMAFGLYAFQYRDSLVHDPRFRPLLSKACVLFKCTLPPSVDLGALKVLKRSVFSHPTIEDALVIDLAFVNQASFDQPYPILDIRLTDRNGRLVDQNLVAPADYLDQWQTGDMLQQDKRLDLSLTVEDPGQTATSFELKFR